MRYDDNPLVASVFKNGPIVVDYRLVSGGLVRDWAGANGTTSLLPFSVYDRSGNLYCGNYPTFEDALAIAIAGDIGGAVRVEDRGTRQCVATESIALGQFVSPMNGPPYGRVRAARTVDARIGIALEAAARPGDHLRIRLI